MATEITSMIYHQQKSAVRAVGCSRSYTNGQESKAGRCWWLRRKLSGGKISTWNTFVQSIYSSAATTMGCLQSLPKDDRGKDTYQTQTDEMFVFVPGIRSPCKTIDVANSLNGILPTDLGEHLTALRTRIEVMASTEGLLSQLKPKRKTATQNSGSIVADLQLAVEDYLPLILGLADEETKLTHAAVFSWTNQEDSLQETSISNSLYELLSVLQLAAILALFQANLLLTTKAPADGSQPQIIEENKRTAIGVFLKASGILKCAINSVVSQMSEDLLKKLPADLSKGTLHALCMQALGQGVEVQLSFAVENVKATLAVKRRLACEQVKCWKQVHESILTTSVASAWGEKHHLFIKWKLAEAKAVAYYFHGLMLNEGSDEKMHTNAMQCLQLAESFLTESQKLCTDFCSAAPATRVPQLWGGVKYLSENIHKDASIKESVNKEIRHLKMASQNAPDLPDFLVGLQPEPYHLPPIDSAWNLEHSKSTLAVTI